MARAMLGEDPGAPPPATPADLRRFLEQPLGRRLPLNPVIYDQLRGDVYCHRVLHLVEATSEAYSLSATIFVATETRPCGASAVSRVIDVAALIVSMFVELQALTGLLPHRMDHGTLAHSEATRPALQPAFCLWVDGTLVFKGEVKARSRDMGIAVEELGAKMGGVWSPIAFGDLPYLLCYAAAGPELQFYVVPKGQPRQPVSISKRFNLSVMADRIEVVHHLVNLFRLLCWGLRPLLPLYPVSVGDVLRRPNGTTITILADGAVKRIEAFDSNSRGVEFEDLANVYSVTRRAEGLIHAREGPVLDDRTGSYTVTLAPLGNRRRPADEGELRQAIRAVLRGVAALHAAGYVHRDIRWDNVLCTGEGSWILSDLESVARAPAPAAGEGGEGGFRAACWTSDTLDERGEYTTASDVELVGRLMETCGILALGPQCAELEAQLTAAEAASRPSAEQALRHPWFSVSGAP